MSIVESFAERSARLSMEEEQAAQAIELAKEMQIHDLMVEEYQNQLNERSMELELIAYHEYRAGSDIQNYLMKEW